MKVTLVLATSTGGVGAHVRSLAGRLPALGVAVQIACPPETAERFRFAKLGVLVHPVEISGMPRPRADLAAVSTLRSAVAGSDVVHAHGFRAAALTGMAMGRRRPGRVPLVATWHNAVLGDGIRRRVLAGLETLAARRADLTLGASSDLVARARELGAPDARVAPVAAPAMNAPAKDRAQVRRELGVTDESTLVLAVGRLAPQKDYPTLLAAARGWRDQNVAVVIAGDGPIRPELQSRIEGDRLPVRLLGHRDDVADLLGAADIYVLTSAWEARPLVVQEAMAAGVPVVATAVGGVPELVGGAAILIPPGSAEELATRVAVLARDAEARQELAARGRSRAAGWPTEDDTARDLVAVYREVAAD